MTDTLMVFYQVAQGIYAAFMTAVILVRPLREWFFNMKKKHHDEEEKEKNRWEEMRIREDADREGIKCLLRDNITRFYYAHCSEKKIHAYELENVNMQYHAYKNLNGNSYIDIIYAEICEWDIIK